MNKTLKTLALASALPLLSAGTGALAHGMAGSGMSPMMGGAMMQQQMTKMHERMQKNHELMQQIMNEPDIATRQSMMRQHMESMHEQMHMLNPGTAGEGGAQPPADMREHMNQMDMRMNMMQMMMEQMMEHQQQMQ